ncbi:amidohydrolase [Mycobacterium sp. 852013-51886_SCH5428379]|uniref:amidohydrolase family protein n=1 Tax=Mycobacterium sp. 852013-51886_SCH5428379 TaxID=1834111 RepID=UPI000800A70E|nr:amidohydrolase family protein [Mycobacterium sp. 852013-51886_SCH5428379]OBB57414.1 amidohydrolase [Mycobacterium sp. 852013-51886_SCH5428379]
MLIKRARLLDGRRVDVRVTELIDAVADTLDPWPGEDVFDAAGMTVIPGLHDHHLHIRSAAAASGSIRVGPAAVAGRAALGRLLRTATPGADGWIRGIDYHEAAAGPLDRTVLDDLAPGVPVRIQHRTGALWMMNSAGLRLLGRSDHPDGRLRSADTTWGTDRRALPTAEWSRRLLQYGITGITDATPDLDPADLPADLRQRVHVLAPGKRILHDDGLDLDELTAWIDGTHAADVPVGVHCVTAAQLVVTIAALRLAGTRPGDRIEHAAVVPDDCVADLADLGVTVVTQPNFVAERGDQYIAEVPATEHHELWRVATLLDAGIPVALSTDTPFGAADPWAAMRAAVHRRAPCGDILGPRERIKPATALAMFTGSGAAPADPRTVTLGQPGDLCLLAADPADVLAILDADLVAATVIAGEVHASG